MKITKLLLSIVFILSAGLSAVDGAATTQDTNAAAGRPATSTAPATQPRENVVLIRLGDKPAVTQMEFELMMLGIPVQKYESYKNPKIRELLGKKIFMQYVADHPDLVSEKQIDQEIENVIKKAKLKDINELQERLDKYPTSMADFRARKKYMLAMTNLKLKVWKEQAENEDFLKKMFEEHPADFDGTRVEARHIMIALAPYDTPEQKEAKRKKLERIRQDIISGKRTWDQCVVESDSNTKLKGGNLGSFNRHLRLIYGEPVAKTAFEQKVGQLSEVVEEPFGYHIIETLKRIPGTRDYEEAKRHIKSWLLKKVENDILEEVVGKYPIIGVNEPTRPAFLESMFDTSASQPATRPATQPLDDVDSLGL